MHLPFDKDCCALNISVIIVQLTMGHAVISVILLKSQ